LKARVLRYLSIRGIFEEVTQGVFVNSLSSATIANNPEFKAHLDLVYVLLKMVEKLFLN